MYPYPMPNDDNPLDPLWGNTMNVSSGTDLTGLTPTAVMNDQEEENYNELYDFLPNPPESSHNIRA